MRKAVVVDDDDGMRELMVELLRDRYQVSSASDGETGLAMVKAQRPDVLVLDLLMPRMHGFEVCQRLRADPALKDLKILIASSKSYQTDMRSTCEETGADAYLVKPFDIQAFNKAVDSLFASVPPA